MIALSFFTLQVLSSDQERNEHQKLIMLGVWQEMVCIHLLVSLYCSLPVD